ncbi:glycerol-3-phosphate responsive antiterminator [Paenibacillus sp. Leaf72]|uniref:glycerol-3-phosphate responsive antiterminator n=1 Tax=Paenibacillus sp. Leaf72 TaxID=1736234 RepID=UPI0006F5472F|nr:glycerol-3-phosphate responsive antiterminator [Paenibacillus sp. Leaf72]KQO17850.1 transcriptional regulator [Paenibacillus sp. Leaf72]
MQPNTVIPAIRNFKELEQALASPQPILFLLEGELIQLQGIADAVRSAGKKLFLHLDMVKGIKDDEASIHYLAKAIKIDGVISTRTSSLLLAKKHRLAAIQRGFLIDSHSVKTIINTAAHVKPDYIELLPSFAHSMVGKIRQETNTEIILGGFVHTREDLPALFGSGAIAVSSSNAALWNV